jgi:hypothetical protein
LIRQKTGHCSPYYLAGLMPGSRESANKNTISVARRGRGDHQHELSWGLGGGEATGIGQDYPAFTLTPPQEIWQVLTGIALGEVDFKGYPMQSKHTAL